MSTVDTHDAESWLRLTFVQGVTASSLRALLKDFGSPGAVLAAPVSALRNHVVPQIANVIANGGNADVACSTLEWLKDPNNHLVTLSDAEYPRLLLETSDPPPVLFVKGRPELLNSPALAIVGSRNSTAQGNANATDFALSLSDAGITIVSGLALGIDAAAHQGGLAGKGSSIAFVGTGLDVVYPARNRALAHELAAKGALVSEFPLGTPPLASNFPRRNRLISGMTLGCLVIEAALQSGSLITARLATEQGREVFALPGSIHSPLAKGCHRLIKQGAKLVDDANDILEELRLPSRVREIAAPPSLERDEASIFECMDFGPCSLDTVCARADLRPDIAAATLLQLELKGLIEQLPGGRYQRIR